MTPERTHTENVQYPGKVISHGHQAKFPAAFCQSAHQEMVHAGTVFEGAKRMFNHDPAPFHAVGVLVHALLVAFGHRLMFPAGDLPGGRFFGQALFA